MNMTGILKADDGKNYNLTLTEIQQAPADTRPVYEVHPGSPIPLGDNRRIIFLSGYHILKEDLWCGFADLSLEGQGEGNDRPVLMRVNLPPKDVYNTIIDCPGSGETRN